VTSHVAVVAPCTGQIIKNDLKVKPTVKNRVTKLELAHFFSFDENLTFLKGGLALKRIKKV